MNAPDGFGIVQTFIAVLIASFIYVSLWYAFALRYKRIDIIDSAWGLGFIYVAFIALLLQPEINSIQLITLGLVSLWGLRLFLHITSRNLKKKEDSRYTLYRKQWGSRFKIKAYLNIYLVQGALIAMVSLPVLTIMNYPFAPLNTLIYIGFIVWVAGLAYESIADYQLRQFLKHRKPHEIMQSGLWKYSRHPNYFGELTAWYGAGIVAAGLGGWWGFIGPIILTYVIVKISGLPPLEKRYADNSAYQSYKKKTSTLIPLPQR